MSVRIAIILFAVLLAACGRQVRTAPALAACPAPRLDTSEWRATTDSLDVHVRIPPQFVEQPRSDGARRWHLGGDFSEYILTGFIRSSSPVETLGRSPGVGMMEMSQCIDSIGGRQVLVQSWRTIGGTFRQSRRMDRYDVFAVVAVTPELRFYLSSGSHRPATQRTALAVVRTIVIAPAESR